jgi:nucleoside-triphosphatase THEP1
MDIACVGIHGRGETDRFIAQVATALEAAGLRLAGTVQTNTDRPGRRKCDMELRVLPDGPAVRISEDRGGLARGCILDSGALEQTVVAVLERLAGADCLIVNKFGKRESEGRGMVPVIAAALERGMPVLVGVNALNMPDFLNFAGELALPLPAEVGTVADWCLGRCRTRDIDPQRIEPASTC